MATFPFTAQTGKLVGTIRGWCRARYSRCRKGNPGIVTWVATDFFPIDTTFYVVPKNSNQNLYFLFYSLEGQDLSSIAADSAVPRIETGTSRI